MPAYKYPTPCDMPYEKYKPFRPFDARQFEALQRTWPANHLQHAPVWCSVDLRDGNQALIDPMDPDRKLRFFETLVGMGFKEIEVGFPAASQPDFEFIRQIIEEDRVPDDVAIQVLVQCRPELIERTFEAIAGARHAIVHFYNSTSVLQRRVVFGLGQEGITDIATSAARLVKKFEETIPQTKVSYEYSPESFTGTEPEYAVEICAAVMDVIDPDRDNKIVINLPNTVEMFGPNTYADVIEYVHRNIPRRDAAIISVHPHNDRGTAVAAAELAQLAGADRVEGTLFGNGERTGNVDVVTLALNLMSEGIDPKLDLHDIDHLRQVAEHCNRLPVHPRHPYAGDLVYTAFSGSHQDAIKKGMDALANDYDQWEVPYLPIDPKHVGRTYEAIIRVNSQSGKGGVAYLMANSFGGDGSLGDAREHNLDLPRGLQIEFSKKVQAITEASGTEIKPAEMWSAFTETYLPDDAAMRLISSEVSSGEKGTHVVAQVLVDGHHRTLEGQGNGPLNALVNGIRAELGIEMSVDDYHEHALTSGAEASAAAYVAATGPDGHQLWGVGIHSSILDATLAAVISAANRLRAAESGPAGAPTPASSAQAESPAPPAAV